MPAAKSAAGADRRGRAWSAVRAPCGWRPGRSFWEEGIPETSGETSGGEWWKVIAFTCPAVPGAVSTAACDAKHKNVVRSIFQDYSLPSQPCSSADCRTRSRYRCRYGQIAGSGVLVEKGEHRVGYRARNCGFRGAGRSPARPGRSGLASAGPPWAMPATSAAGPGAGRPAGVGCQLPLMTHIRALRAVLAVPAVFDHQLPTSCGEVARSARAAPAGRARKCRQPGWDRR